MSYENDGGLGTSGAGPTTKGTQAVRDRGGQTGWAVLVIDSGWTLAWRQQLRRKASAPRIQFAPYISWVQNALSHMPSCPASQAEFFGPGMAVLDTRKGSSASWKFPSLLKSESLGWTGASKRAVSGLGNSSSTQCFVLQVIMERDTYPRRWGLGPYASLKKKLIAGVKGDIV